MLALVALVALVRVLHLTRREEIIILLRVIIILLRIVQSNRRVLDLNGQDELIPMRLRILIQRRALLLFQVLQILLQQLHIYLFHLVVLVRRNDWNVLIVYYHFALFFRYEIISLGHVIMHVSLADDDSIGFNIFDSVRDDRRIILLNASRGIILMINIMQILLRTGDVTLLKVADEIGLDEY